MGRPAAGVLKQANAANSFVLTEIKPVLRPARHIDQIARFDLDGEYGAVLRMNVKHAAAADSETDLVLGVRVLLAELGKHRIEIWSRRRDVDHVGGDKAAGVFQAVDLWG